MGCGSQRSQPQVRVIKVALIGDRGSGKSSLISCFLMHRFKLDYNPTTAANIGMKAYTFRDSTQVVTLEVWELNDVKKLPTNFNHVILTLDCTRDTVDLSQSVLNYVSKFHVGRSEGLAVALTKADAVHEDRERLLALMYKTLGVPEGVKIYLTSACEQIGIDEMFKDLANPEMRSRTISRDTSVAAM